MATHYQANLPDMSAKIHTAKPPLRRKKIGAVDNDTDPAAMDSTLRFLILLEPHRDALYELYRLLVIARTLPATSAGCERSFSKRKLKKHTCATEWTTLNCQTLALFRLNLNGPRPCH